MCLCNSLTFPLPLQASPGNLSQLEEILFGANSDCTVTTGVMAVKVAPDGNQKVSAASLGTCSMVFTCIFCF